MFQFTNGGLRHRWILLWGGPVIAAALVYVAAPWKQKTTECLVDQSAENLAQLVFRTAQGNVTAVAERVEGYIYWEDKSLLPPFPAGRARLYLEVPLAQIETGDRGLNRTIRESCLEADWFPYLRYDGAITAVESNKGDGVILTVTGTLDLHGASRELTTRHEMRPDGDCYRLSSRFDINLTDHDVAPRRLLLFRAQETVGVELDLRVREVPTKGA